VIKAIFLDRDGVINRKAPEGEYIRSWDEFEFLPGVGGAVRRLNDAEYLVIIVTNQRGVARGQIISSELDRIHQKLVSKLADEGATIHGIYYCPHALDENCGCRKPQPGLLTRAVEEFGIDTKRSWMIGDSVADVQAGQRAGCRTILVNTTAAVAPSDQVELTAKDLAHAVRIILEMDVCPAQ
jgi:histidinol-phosphate phosphatase family protein